MTTEELDQLNHLTETLTGIRNGKPWEAKITSGLNATWFTPDHSLTPVRAIELRYSIRLKPWTLPPPPEGKQWHRGAEFTEADLPEGYRPLLAGEETLIGDEVWACGLGPWVPNGGGGRRTLPNVARYRTKRPLPVEDPYAELKAAHAAGKVIQYLEDEGDWSQFADGRVAPKWTSPPEFYRVKPDPIPLGPEDVPPGSSIRGVGETKSAGWCLITSCTHTGIRIWRHSEENQHEITWESLKETGSQILRPGQDWQPCSKPQP